MNLSSILQAAGNNDKATKVNERKK